jgi:hypothetical protein
MLSDPFFWCIFRFFPLNAAKTRPQTPFFDGFSGDGLPRQAFFVAF